MKVLLLLSLSFPIAVPSCNLAAFANGRQERGTAPSPVSSGYHALVIGNNDYRSLPKLKTAAADARAVAAVLKEVYGFETRLLTDATRAQIVSALYSYRRTLGPEASLLIYYAGHGINDREADKAYWLPVDATRNDESTWIIADEITTGIKVIPARHVLVVSDSCYSGTLTRGLNDSLPRASQREQFIQRMMAGKSRTLMASGGDEPVADGGGGIHSIFASALIRGLRDIDKPRFTGAELFRSYVEEPVAGRAQQTPEYSPIRNSGHESGDFVFVKLKPNGTAAESAATATKAPAGPVDPSVFELEFWNAIKDSRDPEDYKEYLKKYPDGRFVGIAKRRADPSPVAPYTAPRSVPRIEPGTIMLVKLLTPIATDASQVGDRFEMEVIEPQEFAGLNVGGILSKVQRPSGKSPGQLKLDISSIMAADGFMRIFSAQVIDVVQDEINPNKSTTRGSREIRLERGQKLRIRCH